MPGGKTIREAIVIAMEALPGDIFEWAIVDAKTMRDHVINWVHEYARRRGVILEDRDIKDELVVIVRELRRGVKPGVTQ